jgi:hypothetical protein
MTYELTADEKRNVVNNQMRNVAYKKYIAEVELIIENAITPLNTARISDLNTEILKCDDQLAALTAELEKIG